MTSLTTNQRINRLRFIAVSLAVLLILSAVLIVNLQKERNLAPSSVGGKLESVTAKDYVRKYTEGIFVFDHTTTSFLLEKSLLDSLSDYPNNATRLPIYYRIFFAKNEKDKKTLVITGAYLDSSNHKIINTHIHGDYDIEHVFPIDDLGNVYEIDKQGVTKKVWTAFRFPDNTN